MVLANTTGPAQIEKSRRIIPHHPLENLIDRCDNLVGSVVIR